MERVVGLDFGTTNSAIAVAGCDGKAQLARFGDAGSFRSILYFPAKEKNQTVKGEIHANARAEFTPDKQAGAAIYIAIQSLSPKDDTQKSLKTNSLTLATQIAELRALLVAQAGAYISRPLLVVLVTWLVVIFLSFSVLAPRNSLAMTTLLVSVFSISGAMFLIIELDNPFAGLIRISSEPLLRALATMGS